MSEGECHREHGQAERECDARETDADRDVGIGQEDGGENGTTRAPEHEPERSDEFGKDATTERFHTTPKKSKTKRVLGASSRIVR